MGHKPQLNIQRRAGNCQELEQQLEAARAEIVRLNREADRLQQEVQDFANSAGAFLLSDARGLDNRFERFNRTASEIPTRIVAFVRQVFGKAEAEQTNQINTLASQLFTQNSNGSLSGRIPDMLPYIAAGMFLRGRQHMAIDILEALQSDTEDKPSADLSAIINRLSLH